MRFIILLMAILPSQFVDRPRPRGLETGSPYDPTPPAVREAAAALFRSDNFTAIDCLPHYWRRHLSEAQIKKLVANLALELENPESLKLKALKGLVIPGHVEPENVEEHLFLRQDILRVNGRAANALEALLNCYLPEFLDEDATDPAKVKEAARRARRTVLDRLCWPAPARPGVPTFEEVLVSVVAALEDFLLTREYTDMIDMVDRWSREMPEPALKLLTAALLDRLTDAETVPFGTHGSMFVLSQILANKGGSMVESEMVEQDVDYVNGRCAWALERLLGCVLPSFTAAVNADPRTVAARARRSYALVVESMTMPPARKVLHHQEPFDGRKRK